LQGLAEERSFPPEVLVLTAGFASAQLADSETKNAKVRAHSEPRFLLGPIFIFHIVENSQRLV